MILKQRFIFLFVLLLFFAGLNILSAEKIIFTAERSFSERRPEGDDIVVLEGSARIRLENSLLEAYRVRLWGKDYRYIEAEGQVRFVDHKENIFLESQKFFYDQEKKLLKISGQAVAQEEKEKIVLRAEYIDYDQEQEIMIAQVAVRLFKDDLFTKSEYAIFHRQSSQLHLTGSPTVYQGVNIYRSRLIVVNTKDNSFSLEGSIEGLVEEKPQEISNTPSSNSSETTEALAEDSPSET